jgi:hypothetical protein
MTMHHKTCVTAIAIAMGIAGQLSSAHAAILTPSVPATGPTYGAPYEVTKMFDATVTDADVGVTSYGGSDGQWAGPGAGPHEIFMDYGTSVAAVGFAFSQRAGNDPVADKVGQIEFWFSDTDYLGVFPVTAPDATSLITNTTDTVLTRYDFPAALSGQYVAAKFSAASLAPATNNPGGSEFRLIAVPEPGAALLTLATIGVAAAGWQRSPRTTLNQK